MSVTLHTNFGPLKVELFCQKAPKTTYNFLALCASGYYDQCKFHRSIPQFMIQGGDPSGTGKGGKSCWNMPFDDEFDDDLRHEKRGILSMANSGPGTNQSQFFIIYDQQNHLNHSYPVFGQLIDGFSTLDDMEKVPCNVEDVPEREIKILKVTIHSNPFADKLIPEPDPPKNAKFNEEEKNEKVKSESKSNSEENG